MSGFCLQPAHFRALAAAILFSVSSAVLAQTTGGTLSVSFVPRGAAAKEKAIPVAGVAGGDIVVKNDGDKPLTKVRLLAKLDLLALANKGEWKAEGEDYVLEIPEIKAKSEIKIPLSLRVEAAPLPPGRKAQIVIEAKSGDVTAQAQGGLQVADCATAFHAELTRIRIGPLAEIRTIADDYRKPDLTLPRGRFFRVVPRKGDLGNLDRIAAGYQARMTANPEFGSEGMRYTIARWTNELRDYTGQEVNPGLCAGNYYMISGIRQTISPVTGRLDAPRKAAERALNLLRKETSAKDDEDLVKIALRVAENAGAKIENPPATAFAILERARDLLKDKPLPEDQLALLSLVETVAWIDAAGTRADKFAGAIENTIKGFSDAQHATCTCAF